MLLIIPFGYIALIWNKLIMTCSRIARMKKMCTSIACKPASIFDNWLLILHKNMSKYLLQICIVFSQKSVQIFDIYRAAVIVCFRGFLMINMAIKLHISQPIFQPKSKHMRRYIECQSALKFDPPQVVVFSY